jgi:hypothetical protein
MPVDARVSFDEHIKKPADPLRIALLAAGIGGRANDEKASRPSPG